MSDDLTVQRAQVTGLPRHVIGVAAVVIDDDGHALVVRRHTPARWELPGGALEIGETLAAGLVREVREEIGLTVDPVRLTGVYQNMTLGPTSLAFWSRRLSGEERLSPETTDWRWLARGELDDLMPPAWAVRFHDAFDACDSVAAGADPGPVRVRPHDGHRLL